MTDDAQETPRTADELRSLTFGFDEHPLEHFRGLSAEEIEAHAGIGPKFRVRIQEALSELATLTGEPLAEPPSAPPPAESPTAATAAPLHNAPAVSHHVVDDDLEPVGPGTGGPLMIVAVIVLVLLIIGSAIWVASDRDGSAELQTMLLEANQQVAASQEVFGKLAVVSAAQAERQATAVFAAARARNIGAALEQLDDLEATLGTMAEATAAAASVATTAGAHDQTAAAHGDAAHADPRSLLATATEALNRARAALLMTQPQTQSGLESACRNLEQAVRALGGDEVKE